MTNGRHVALGTVSFTVCFAAWGLIGAFAPRFREAFHLTASETALLVAVPVLLGSLARIPMGMLTDRFGGRAMFAILMAAVALPVWIVPQQTSYSALLTVAFSARPGGLLVCDRRRLRLALDAAREQQGSALGVYGLGNIGQSAAVFLGPVLAARVGMAPVYRGVAVLLVVWAAVFAAAGAQCAARRRRGAPPGLGAMLQVLTREKLAWLLAAFYFLTFGGFVAFSIYLPTLLRDEFHLAPADAGFRTAGFVVLATLLRPLGGWLVGPDRRRAGAVGGVRRRRSVRPAAGMALDAPVHGRRARLRRVARPRQRRGVQTRAAILSRRRPAPSRAWWARWAASAASSRRCCWHFSAAAPARSGRASCCWPRVALLLWWANHRVFVPRQQSARPRAARRPAPHRRPPPRRRLGHALDGAAGRRRSSSARAICRTSIPRW